MAIDRVGFTELQCANPTRLYEANSAKLAVFNPY
jgi:hypothetical protein